MHLLIPYRYLAGHSDPMFSEFTYGDVRQRARQLKATLGKGDYVFFHASRGGKKHITAYYVVDRVLDTAVACQDKTIVVKYKNPHILECLDGERPLDDDDDVIVFGDPITSHVLDHALPFDQGLAEQLSLGIRFPPRRTEAQAIGSATRSWRQLTDEDVDVLLSAIRREQTTPRPRSLRSTDEVTETIERDVEELLAGCSELIGPGLTLEERQREVEGGRIDLLFKGKHGSRVVVEVKLNRIGRGALQQVRNYVDALKAEGYRQVSGVLVCAGVMPAYENELRRQRRVRILIYGWDLKVQPW